MSSHTCRLCSETKSRADFSPDKRQRSGLQAWCKRCRSKKESARVAPKFAEMRKRTAAKVAAQIAQTEKPCSRCKVVKPLDAFWADPKMRQGKQSRCVECLSALAAEWYARNPEHLSAYRKARYAEIRESDIARVMAQYKARLQDPELRPILARRAREATRKWRSANPEKARAKTLEWNRNNPEKVRQMWARKRLKRMSVPSDLTIDQWLEQLEVFDHRCAYCLCELDKPTKDHIIALVRGGNDTIDNIVPACLSCNVRKNAKPVWSMVNTPSAFNA
jgi:5-methylcytosine-specific restriction endonuclease McrA